MTESEFAELAAAKFKPIETAPTDGTLVDVTSYEALDAFGEPIPARMVDGEWRAIINTVPATLYPTHWLQPALN